MKVVFSLLAIATSLAGSVVYARSLIKKARDETLMFRLVAAILLDADFENIGEVKVRNRDACQ